MVWIFRTDGHTGDTTAGGISSRHSRGILTGPGIVEMFDPSDDMPEYVLVSRPNVGRTKCGACGARFTYLHAVPKELEGRQSMFGGNFLKSSDSRFPNDYPIPIHDRVEEEGS